jgi:hypothetical protein
MNRTEALPFVSYAVDDALSERAPTDAPENARLVGWHCRAEPLFVAVWSYLGVTLDDEEAEELARDILQERRWFADNDNPPPADYVL